MRMFVRQAGAETKWAAAGLGATSPGDPGRLDGTLHPVTPGGRSWR